jgi:hypothetical protein
MTTGTTHRTLANLAGCLLVASSLAAVAPTAVPPTTVAPAQPSPAAPAAAKAPDPTPIRQIVRERWSAWFGDRTHVTATDLGDEAASAAVRGEEAAAVAAVIQELTRLKAKESVDGIDRAQLLPEQGDGDAAMWKRLEANYKASLRKERSIPTKLWAHDGPSFEGVRQAREGDCWLLATTGWMVKHRPEAVRKAIEPAGDGKWRVNFADGASVEVSTPTVTELISVNSEPTLKDGLWLPVVKEAMGELIGEANPKKHEIEAESLRINGGSGARMFERWTGHKVKVIRLDGKERPSIADVRAALVDGVRRHAAMGAGTPKAKVPAKAPEGADAPKDAKAKPPAIAPNHAYAIFGFDADRDVVITWNPWGNDFKPAGPDGRENGYTRKAGIAEIPLADFVELFRGLWIETDEPAPRASKAAAPARGDDAGRGAGSAPAVSP